MAEAVISVLEDRRGFDHWWDYVDPEAQRHIKNQIAGVLYRLL